MMRIFKRLVVGKKLALGSAAISLLATTATPAFAVNIHQSASIKSGPIKSGQSHIETGLGYDRYHRDRYRNRGHDRIDGGDVLAGIGILAAIAIIADSARKSDRNKRRSNEERYPERNPRDNRNAVPDGNTSAGSDLGVAVDVCTRAAEQSAGNNARVQEIRSVTREGAGWQVAGDLSGSNRGFSCAATGGVVDYVRLDDGRNI